MVDSIILVEGDAAALGALQPVLTRDGYRPECIRRGLDAIHRTLLTEPDLVILGSNSRDPGWELCEQVLVFCDKLLLLLLSGGNELDRVLR